MTTTRLARVAAALLLTTITTLTPAAPAHADDIRDQQWFLDYLHIPQAQHISQGDGVTVAVIDTGVDPTLPELSGNLLPGADAVAGLTPGQRDLNGHGTAMACLIACHGTGPHTGALGIAPHATILPIAIGGIAHDDIDALVLASAITWAVDHGADVINLSLGGPPRDDLRHAIAHAITHDVIVIAAVGNKPDDPIIGYPAAYPGVVAVAATDRHGHPADFSVSGPQVLLAAPGTDILTAGPHDVSSSSMGTSDATAIVSGVAALIRARHPHLTATQVIHLMTATATDTDPPGRDNHTGYGIVNPLTALTTNPTTLTDTTPTTAGTTNPTTQTDTTPTTAGTTNPTTQTDTTPGDHHTTIAIIIAIAAGAALLIIAVAAILLIRRQHSG